VSGGLAAAAMRHRHGRQRVAQSGSGGKKRRKKVTINQMCGSVSGGVVALPRVIVTAGSGQGKVDMAAEKKEKR